MSKLFLDLHKMTHAGEKGEHAIFEHKDGHSIHVKKSALTPKMRADLEQLVKTKMAKGGEIKQSNPKLEESKKVPMAEGGEPNSSTLEDTPEQIVADAQSQSPMEDPEAPDQMGEMEKGSFELPESVASKDAPPVTDSQPSASPPTSDPGPANPPAPQPSSSAKEDTGYGGVLQGVNERVAGRQAQANAEQSEATQKTAAIEANNKARQAAVAHDQANMDALMQERQSILHDIKNGHIDPNKYLKDMSTVGKISTGIGLILGGIGGGLTGQENPALKYLNAQIDRNIDAQTKELGKNENLLSANMRQFGNLQAARDFTRINMNDALTHQIELAAAKNGGAQAQASAQQAIGQIHQDTGMLQAKLGAQMTLNSPQSKESDVQNALQRARMLAPDTAKEFENRYVPGVGVAQKPLSEQAVQKFNGMHEFDVAMKNLYDFAKAHSGETKFTNPQDVRYGRALAQAAQNSYREAQGLGVYKASEAPLLEGEIPADPTAFLNKYRVLPQYQAVIDNNKLKLNALKQSYQVRPFADQQQAQGPAPRFAPRK